MKKVILKKGRETSVFRRHLWVFSGGIHSKDRNIQNGDLVEILDHENQFLALGHYQDASIALRIISFEKVEVNEAWWKSKLETALAHRLATVIGINRLTNCFRLVHGEGDNLPGLIIDIYNNQAVIELHSTGMARHSEEIASALLSFSFVVGVIIKDSQSEEAPLLVGETESMVIVKENELHFHIDLIEGQKTGFFLDQRNNRKLLGQYALNKKVLNTFCYTGGFSVYASIAGAELVLSADISKKAMELLDKNMLLNSIASSKIESQVVDVMKYLKEIPNDFYDIIILDPPAFAKHKSAYNNAVRAYAKLNQMAIEKLPIGGMLFTFSCSQVVDKQAFKQALFTAGARAKKTVQIIHQLHQPEDHPVNLFHPESEYLKGFVCMIGE